MSSIYNELSLFFFLIIDAILTNNRFYLGVTNKPMLYTEFPVLFFCFNSILLHTKFIILPLHRKTLVKFTA